MTNQRPNTTDYEATHKDSSGPSLLVVGETCATCADEARPARVLSVDTAANLALVTIGDMSGEVDISLIDHVEPGMVLLIHGGVAVGTQ